MLITQNRHLLIILLKKKIKERNSCKYQIYANQKCIRKNEKEMRNFFEYYFKEKRNIDYIWKIRYSKNQLLNQKIMLLLQNYNKKHQPDLKDILKFYYYQEQTLRIYQNYFLSLLELLFLKLGNHIQQCVFELGIECFFCDSTDHKSIDYSLTHQSIGKQIIKMLEQSLLKKIQKTFNQQTFQVYLPKQKLLKKKQVLRIFKITQQKQVEIQKNIIQQLIRIAKIRLLSNIIIQSLFLSLYKGQD